ncbi:hypothetical protein PGT21_016798 [Puccinia graminis f. sp. tritici]|uniref:Uncharacterized protein n=1 Tax=Puccinia graminis f. sp. tritici TaxID=56615 RepID=A0A5B0P1L6_PUCGR|nr:hypothetical protein PGT21_016798 [Puccinia graminis f. sp. tritici]
MPRTCQRSLPASNSTFVGSAKVFVSTPSPIVWFGFVILHPPAVDRLLSIDAKNFPMFVPACNGTSLGSAKLLASIDQAKIPTDFLFRSQSCLHRIRQAPYRPRFLNALVISYRARALIPFVKRSPSLFNINGMDAILIAYATSTPASKRLLQIDPNCPLSLLPSISNIKGALSCHSSSLSVNLLASVEGLRWYPLISSTAYDVSSQSSPSARLSSFHMFQNGVDD